MHADIQPFRPMTSSTPLLGQLNVVDLHLTSLALGVLGLILLLIRRPWRRAGAVLGLLHVTAGGLLVVAALLYCATGWRYGAVIAIWAAEWGLPLIGVGTGLARFGRRGASAIAFGCGLGGILLIVIGEVSREYGSYPVAGAIGGVAILVGIASAIARRRAKVSPSNPESGDSRSWKREGVRGQLEGLEVWRNP